MSAAATKISDGKARRIASEWHDGQWSALYMFASTGATEGPRYDVDGVLSAIERSYPYATDTLGRQELAELEAYVTAVGNRGTVTNWSKGWE